MKIAIVCVEAEEEARDKLEKQLAKEVGLSYEVRSFLKGNDAFKFCESALKAGFEIPLLLTALRLPDLLGDELLLRLQHLSPMTKTILLLEPADLALATAQAEAVGLYRYLSKPWQEADLSLTVREALKSYFQEKDLKERLNELETERLKVMRERKVIDTLSKILTDKIEEIEKQKAEIEEVSKELNITTVEKFLIEQEAEKLSQRLSSLQNNLKNNLFLRSILHTIVNMLQVQFTIDKQEDTLLAEGEKFINKNNIQVLNYLTDKFFPSLKKLRRKTELNLHKSLTAYVKAVQRSLLGQAVYSSPRPTLLLPIVNRVMQKYKDVLEDKKHGYSIQFQVALHDENLALGLYDFALISIIENLLTNSIRKVLEGKKPEMWIRLESYEERKKTETFIVLKWMDNGTGVEPERKLSIFAGDSDKTEEGDHGIGLCDIKNSIEAVGGFVQEVGTYGQGAIFLLGFPKLKHGTSEEEQLELSSLVYKTVLIASEDEMAINKLEEALNKLGLTQLEIWAEADALLKRLAENTKKPDLIIVDESLPWGGNGNLVAYLRQQYPQLALIVLLASEIQRDPQGYTKLIELDKLGLADIIFKTSSLAEFQKKLLHFFKRRA